MKILALEFSSSPRGVAVLDLEAGLVAEVVDPTAGHTMKPFTMIESALRQTRLEREEIDCVVVGLGPGSYTGVRAAIALAQGWQLATGAKLLGVSSAEAVAAQAQADGITGKFSVVIDAQREEFYLAEYEIFPDGMREIAPLRLATLAEVRGRAGAGEPLVGPEVTRWFPKGRLVVPRAVRLGERAATRSDFVAGETLVPIYLRETQFVKSPAARCLPATPKP